jgi:hypothetical protein
MGWGFFLCFAYRKTKYSLPTNAPGASISLMLDIYMCQLKIKEFFSRCIQVLNAPFGK